MKTCDIESRGAKKRGRPSQNNDGAGTVRLSVALDQTSRDRLARLDRHNLSNAVRIAARIATEGK